MADAGRRQIRGDEPLHSLPLDATMLASPAQSAMPEVAHGEAKVGQGVPVRSWYVALHHLQRIQSLTRIIEMFKVQWNESLLI